MSIDLAVKFQPYVDELFSAESKRELVTNNDFNWDGARTVKIYKVSTAQMNDYGRSGPDSGNWSRYGAVENLNATTETLMLSRDRSFTFALDRMDEDETVQQVEAASALARQLREVVVPEVDSYTYGVMAANAGTKAAPLTLDAKSIYDEILTATKVLDNALVPETGRVLIVTPDTYAAMKKCTGITMETDIGQDMRLKGVIGILDGMNVVKVPASRLPSAFGFMAAHPTATVAPVKLESYVTHSDPPGISGDLVEGRVYYDAFVMDNKAMAIYYQPIAAVGLTVTSAAGSASGATKITVTPEIGSGNSYVYKTGTAVDLPALDEDCATGWTSWNGSADITAATGSEIVIVEIDANSKAVKAGKATVTAKA